MATLFTVRKHATSLANDE